MTALASSLPQVKEFLNQYPNAKISVALWDSSSVEKSIDSIRADCGVQFAVADYYKVTVVDPSLSLVVWLDKSGQNVMCAVKGATNQLATNATSVQPAQSATAQPTQSTTVQPASSTTTSSETLPPMPPVSGFENSTGITYEERACVSNGGRWDPACITTCSYNGSNSTCNEVCTPRCFYSNRTVTPTPAAACVTAGRAAYNYSGSQTCCAGLILNASAVTSTSTSMLGYCTYPVPPVAAGCSWVSLECSKYGGYWTGKPIECNLTNEGKVGMGPNGVLGGAYIPESYTSERWSTCFTPRAMCYCGNVVVPTILPSVTPTTSPSPTPMPTVVNCTDLDGNNTRLAGTTTLFYSNGTSWFGEDSCLNNVTTYEWTCGNNSAVSYYPSGIRGDYYSCYPGYCSDGACVNATATPTPTPRASGDCVDTDNGNYYVAGNTSCSSCSLSPDCCTSGLSSGLCIASGPVLKEVYCYNSSYETNLVTAALVTCSNGCVNGACVNATPTTTPSPSPVPVTCNDTDGGINYYVNGVAIWGPIAGQYYNATDGCSSDGKTLSEVYCSGGYSAYAYYSCAGNCANGVCVNATPSPSPSPSPSPAANYSCAWASIECSHYPGIMTSPLVAAWCNSTNVGLIAMVGTDGLHQQQYASTYESSCVTQRVQCMCTGRYSAPSAGTGLATSSAKPWWCAIPFLCG